MTTISLETQETLRQGFKYLNRYMVLMWRLGLGKWLNSAPSILGRYMVIVHTGRKSGLKRFVPVNFTVVDGDIYCTAGFGAGSQWYKNIMAQPQVELWLPDGRSAACAKDVTDADDALFKMRQVLIGSGFAARVAGINPLTITDVDLAKATSDYRLIRLRRTDPLTGANGPGDLAWVWVVLGFLFVLALGKQKRSK